MIPAPFEYQRATSLDDAIAKLVAAGPAGKLIAGGHSLVPLMKLRLSEPAVLIDISRIPDAAGIRDADGTIEIGAGTTHREAAASALLRAHCPAVADAAAVIGDPQVRNRGTVGGSLAHGDPAADYPAALLAVDAVLHLKGPGGWREVAARDFFQGVFTVDLAPDEVLAKVICAPAPGSAYAKLAQRASRFAIVGVAAALTAADGAIRTARVGLTGAAPSPCRLPEVEAALAGRAPDAGTLAAAARAAGDGLAEVNADLHAGADYRRAMIRVFTRRALDAARARLGP